VTARPPFLLYLVTDRVAAGGDDALVRSCAAAARSVPAGLLGIGVREKDLAARDLLDLVRRIRAAVASTGTPVLVNDRLDVALVADADGVHLPGSGLAPSDARRAFGGLIGVSAHSAAALAAFDPACVDFATFGPVFDTPSKRAYGAPQGLDRLRGAATASRVPVLAIGGIEPSNVAGVIAAGAAGVAVIRAVLAAREPGEAAVRIVERVPGSEGGAGTGRG
jgi:thiamine-phosphate pyrophosphorylase